MQLTTENTKEFIEFWNNNKPEGFIHPMTEGIATIIFEAFDIAEYTVNFENGVLSVFDNQTNEDLGIYSLKALFNKAKDIYYTDYTNVRTTRTFGNDILDIFLDKELSPEGYKAQIRDALEHFYQTELFDTNNELNWNTIDYTTKKWMNIDDRYYEYDESKGFLSIAYSLDDLEEEYGNKYFPEKAIEDGNLKIFDIYTNELEDYLREKYHLKDSEEINELLWDYEYQTKDVLKYYIPKIDNEQLEELTDIVDSQNINLESLREISFEDIYNEIDKSKLTQEELEELNKIKEELSKPTVEIFKQSFDSFIMSLSEAASKSIQTDIEKLKSKALYVFNVDNNEYTIVSKRDSENPFMVHKYYPENETGGIHHGSYDIDTYENAEKIAANRLINEQKEKYELINFIAGTREEDFNLELKNELFSVFEYLNKYSLNEEDQIELIDVKAYQYEGPSGKLKVLVEYNGNCREDDLFNLLHDDEENGQNGHDYEINGYKIDLNPIKAEKSGTISEYLTMLKNVEEKWPEVNKLINEQKENVMYKKIHSKDPNGVERWYEYDEKGNEIHYKNSDGFEKWTEYDDKGKVIHFKNSDGVESWTEYDNKGNVIQNKNSSGFEQWYEYDEKDNLIHYKNSDSFEKWTEYDDKGKVIHYKNSDGDEHWNEYDGKGNEIHYKDSKGVESWYEYDDKGNEIHYKDSDGVERWYEYDEKDNLIHYKNSYGFETWQEYDGKGNEIYFKDSNGVECWSEYDEKDNLIHYKSSNGREYWKEYDEKGNLIHYKNSYGFEKWYEYDEKGNQMHYKDSNGFERSSTIEYISKEQYLQEKNNSTQEEQESQMYKKIHIKDSDGVEGWTDYDDKGNVIHFKDSNGFERWYKYDEKGNEIYFKDFDGDEYWQEYDEKGNKIHFKDSNGFEQWFEYDDKGNVIHFKDSDGFERWYKFDSNGNEIHYKDSDGFEKWTEYDGKGNEIHYKNFDGSEEWREYDDKGNEIHFKSSTGLEEWKKYDSNGNIIHYQNSNGVEHWTEYDDKGNVIHFKDSDGVENWKEYDDKGKVIHYKDSNGVESWAEYDEKGNEIHFKNSMGFERSSTVEYLTKEQYLQEKNNSTQEEHSISVDYAFPDDLTYKKEDGNEIKITIYEEPRWDFEDNNELLNIIKEADEDYYDEIKKIITENPSRKFDFDLGKSLRYDDNTFYNSFHIDYSKETLSQKLDNKFIVRYWTTDDTSENKLPQISNYDFAGEDSTIIILNNELSEKLNSMIREHVKNNIERFEQYKTYRNEQISKVLYAEIKQHGEPIVSVEGNGKINVRFQTFTISNDLHDLLELPHFSWHDAQTGKSYPYQYALYADFELDENSIDEIKEPEIKYFEFIDDGTKEIQSADSMKRNSGLLEQNQSIKEVITNTFKQVAQEYYNQNVSIELPLEQQNETTKQLTTENTKKTQMYKKIHSKDSTGYEEWQEYDDKANVIHFKDSTGNEHWKEYDEKGNLIHLRNNNGIELWYEFDEKGNVIHKKDSHGVEEWQEYDEKGNQIHYKDSYGDEGWREYDEKGNQIHFKNSTGYKEWYEYDDKANVIHFKDSKGYEEWFEYNEKGNQIHYKDSDGYEEWDEYDEKGNQIHYKDSYGDEHWKEYDEKGNEIHYKNSDGNEHWKEYDDKGKVIHYKDSKGYEEWYEYDEKGNEIHFKDSSGFEHWKEYDDKSNEIYYKDFKGFERSSTVEYLTKKQYLQEKNNSQIETKYTKADINDLQSFFFSYPQFSESLCYQILDDFELYQIPLFKDSDGNIYQREMNTDLAEGDERDYQLLTQDGIIDQEYNWLIDRKYTSEDEIDLQKELEDIKKFEENPKSYYKNIFKVALEKEIEKVKKEINEGNVKDVIEKNILKIAEEKIGSHAVPEEIIGWYISDDEKNYFENWKNSGDFPDYKEALDSMFAYVYEHDTTKQNLRYVSELNETTQNKLKTLLQEHFEKEGLSEEEINTAIQNAIDSKIDDLNQLMESNEKIKTFFTNEKEWQQAVYEWNERRQGTNSEFKSIGTLIEVDSSDEQQIESLRKNTKDFNIDQKEAKALLSMVNYDSSSFEFMFDIDNGNFVEIDKKNKKIIDVATSKNILGYLTDEIKYIIKEEVSESFTVEELFNANVLNNILEYINKEPRYFQDLNKVEKEAVISGYWEAPDPDMYEKVVEEFYYKKGLKEPEPGLVQYPGDEWVSNYLSENKINFNTEYWNSIFEVVNRQENAFEVAKKYLNEIDSLKEYTEAQKSDFVTKLFNQLKQGWNEHDNQPPSYKELEILIKGIDAFKYGEDSLSFIRPDADDIENGFDNGWDFSEICKGYAEFADGYNESNVICRLDDMMIFDSDSDAAIQAKKDGYQFLEVGKDIIFPEEMLNDDIEYRNYIDTPENRTILKDFLSFAYEKQKEANQVKEAVQKFNKAESLTFGQFNSETNEIKLIKEAYFKELVIDENDTSKNKVVLGFKENGQEQLLEMGEVEYKNLLNAFGFSKEQQENTLEINKYKTFAEEKPEVVFDMIKSDYLGGTLFSDNKLIGYLKGLKKSNNYHHYLDELLFESLKQSDESLFSKVVDAGADMTWRREENGEPINILHYAAADNLNIAIKKIIEKTKSLEVDDYINLFSEENFEGHTPLEIAISNSGGEYFESTKLLIDAMDDEGFSGVEDLLIEDKFGNKVLYTSKDNLDCVSILCFDGNNNIISADTESLVDEKSLGEIISQDLIYQTNNNFIKGNIELNRSSKLISELKEVPQKLWNDEINIKLLKTLPEAGFFNSKKDLYDFDSILALEKIKKSLFSDFDNQKESLLQGLYTKKEFVDFIKEKELNLEELNNCEIGEFVECLENKYFRTELAALCFDKKINELFDTISPRPNEMGMYKNNDYTCLSLKISAASNNRPITEGEAEIILKYIQYENFNFYESMNNELCMLDVSEDFTGEGEIMTPEKIVDMAYRMMIKARDEEYSIYDVKDEEVFNDLRNKFGLIEEQKIKPSKDEKTSVIEQFFSKLKDSICDNAKLEDVLKSAASVLQTFSDTEKKEISQYLRNKDASLGNSSNGLSSILEIKEPGQKKKRSKADDDTRGR